VLKSETRSKGDEDGAQKGTDPQSNQSMRINAGVAKEKAMRRRTHGLVDADGRRLFRRGLGREADQQAWQ